jgi:hypothetical protein
MHVKHKKPGLLMSCLHVLRTGLLRDQTNLPVKGNTRARAKGIQAPPPGTGARAAGSQTYKGST